jgi:hypothetical protein
VPPSKIHLYKASSVNESVTRTVHEAMQADKKVDLTGITIRFFSSLQTPDWNPISQPALAINLLRHLCFLFGPGPARALSSNELATHAALQILNFQNFAII